MCTPGRFDINVATSLMYVKLLLTQNGDQIKVPIFVLPSNCTFVLLTSSRE